MNLKVRLDNDDHYVGGNTKQYLVIHDTGNVTDSDEGNANYFCTGSRNASAHYFVDSDSITQVVKDDDCSWHCGDGRGRYGITNRNSIGIELCRVNNKVTYQTKVNAVELIRMLMNKYNINIDHVVRHYDASRKLCPSSMSANNWAEWYEFKNMITNNTNSSVNNIQSGSLYRVRKSWGDIKSQIGAFTNLENAKKLARDGYKVFNDKGDVIYPNNIQPTQQAAPQGLHIVKEYTETGRATVCCSVLNIRNNCINGSVVGTYNRGEAFYYNYVYILSNNSVWVRYVSYSGCTRYVCVKDSSGQRLANCV